MKKYSVSLGIIIILLSFVSTIFGEILSPANLELLTEQARDTDNDGLYNSLTAEILLDVREEMFFTFEGSLYADAELIAKVYKSVSLGSGMNTVDLAFEGKRIHQSEFDGPYTLSVVVYDQHRNQTGEMFIETLSYRYSEFESQ